MPKDNVVINIAGMHCATCAMTIENSLRKKDGINEAKVNLASEKAYVEYDPQKITLKDLEKIVENAGYKVTDLKSDFYKEKEIKKLKVKFIISFTMSLLLMYFSMGNSFGRFASLAQFILATAIIIFAGSQFFSRGIGALIKNKSANMDTLIALGVGSAYLYSIYVSVAIWFSAQNTAPHNLYYETAGFIITFILLGKWLEAISKGKASEAMRKLIEIQSNVATVIRDGSDKVIPIEEVRIGDIIIVKPGQKIPVDGVVLEGHSSVDESMITGESVPIEKYEGLKVIGGTINKQGFFKFKAEKIGKDTFIANIIRLVEEAQFSKSPIQEIADKISRYFVPIVFLIALSAFIIWLISGQSMGFSLTVFIAVLIISCPCAMGMATATAMVVAVGLGAKNGILIKNRRALQFAGKIKAVIFDKTGTLTKGQPELICIRGYDAPESNILRLAASLEKKSEHPLAEAITKVASDKNIALETIEEFESIPGKGVKAKIGGSYILAGNKGFMQDNNIDIKNAQGDMERLEAEGRTTVLIASGNILMGILVFSDTVRGQAKEAISMLKRKRKSIFMITGDNRKTALSIAKELDIDSDNVLAEVLPQDKAEKIKELQAKGIRVAMVGDGINDAVALAQADIGISVNSGTDIAIESGDIVLMKDDLGDVARAIDLSSYAMKKINQNLFWAFFYNIVCIPIAAGALYPSTGFLLNPMIAGLAMAFSSVSVVGNSLLINRYRLTERR